jgi:hypothetical protein
MLHLSQNAEKQDLKTEVIVKIVRKPVSVLNSTRCFQRMAINDPGIKGSIWFVKVSMPARPESDALDLLVQAIEDIGS